MTIEAFLWREKILFASVPTILGALRRVLKRALRPYRAKQNSPFQLFLKTFMGKTPRKNPQGWRAGSPLTESHPPPSPTT